MTKPGRKLVHSPAGLEIIAGLAELCEVARSGEPLASRFTIHEIEPDFQPGDYAPDDVRHIREDILKLSQPVFARFLGVSVKTVRSWEQGLRPASSIARRFMDEIAAAPAHWRKRMERPDKANATRA